MRKRKFLGSKISLKLYLDSEINRIYRNFDENVANHRRQNVKCIKDFKINKQAFETTCGLNNNVHITHHTNRVYKSKMKQNPLLYDTSFVHQFQLIVSNKIHIHIVFNSRMKRTLFLCIEKSTLKCFVATL